MKVKEAEKWIRKKIVERLIELYESKLTAEDIKEIGETYVKWNEEIKKDPEYSDSFSGLEIQSKAPHIIFADDHSNERIHIQQRIVERAYERIREKYIK